MNKNLLWTHSKARLKLFHADNSKNYNWLFLPGGPGLGSESLNALTEIVNLPGNVWLVDFPGDGSNRSVDSHFSNWQQALIEVCKELENIILVAHSSGGMFTLATPDIEKNLIGLVLIDSAPNADWQKYFFEYIAEHPLVDAQKLQQQYEENPSDYLLKALTIACAAYFSTEKNRAKTISIFETLPFNCQSHLWAEKNFDQTYKAEWVPQIIPTLIFAGDEDKITPLKLFLEAKDFQRKNIRMQELTGAAHFPWLDNPEQVKQLFTEYCQWLESIN